MGSDRGGQVDGWDLIDRGWMMEGNRWGKGVIKGMDEI